LLTTKIEENLKWINSKGITLNIKNKFVPF